MLTSGAGRRARPERHQALILSARHPGAFPLAARQLAREESVPPPTLSSPQRRMPGPLQGRLFRHLWIASVISYTGTGWMQNMSAAWLMTSLTMSPLMVGLVQAAGSIAVFVVVLPAGALADVIDRGEPPLFTQGWMVLSAVGLGNPDPVGPDNPFVVTAVHSTDGGGRGAKRPGMAGDYAGNGIAPELRRRRGAELRRLQRSARHRACPWRIGDCCSRLECCVFCECAFVFWRDLFSVALASEAAREKAERRPHHER